MNWNLTMNAKDEPQRRALRPGAPTPCRCFCTDQYIARRATALFVNDIVYVIISIYILLNVIAMRLRVTRIIIMPDTEFLASTR